MGFPTHLTQLIVRSISSVFYQILINGQSLSTFTPDRGLRQGDPLFPYFFILCANVLFGVIHKEVSSGTIHGLKVARSAPPISHLLFADDNLVFTRAHPNEVDTVLMVLSTYEKVSGQVVNLEKSKSSFIRNVLEMDKNMICNRMVVKTMKAHSRYLGLPIPFGRFKKAIFSFVIDRISKKLKGWREKCLSRAGMETLIKAIAQAIPNYIMGCLKFPEGYCKEIESMIVRFWWGSRETDRKIHWMS